MHHHRFLLTTCAMLSTFAAGCASAPESDVESTGSSSSALTSLTEVTGFGTNPGGLKMYEYVPAGLAAGKPLVLVMHGCTQGAADAAATGWNGVADKYGFAVVYPEQQTANNSVRCFNWAGEYGDPTNLQRGKGENQSIKEMVDKAIATHASDPKRVFVVGFSAGGAESALVAATWPDVFAGGATIAGIPYNCTTTYSEVSSCQNPGKTKTAQQWGDLVRAAYSGYAGPWPRMSIWQGTSDTTVGTANRQNLVLQWADVHGLGGATPVEDTVDGQKHATYKDSAGNALVETYEIAGMSHAVPIDAAGGCGTASLYASDKKICAAEHIAQFFGLDGSGTTTGGGADGGTSADGGGTPSANGGTGGTNGGSAGDGGLASSSNGGNGASGSDEVADRSAGSTCSIRGDAPMSSSNGTGWAVLGAALAAIACVRARRAGARA